jgi:hypothetical protein
MATEIMQFTVLPYELVAKAWLDPTFCDVLLSHPRPFLLDKSDKYSRFAQYIILRDTPTVKHFILPHLSGTFDPKELEAKISDETKDEQDYSEFLPPTVICKALTDETFKTLLVRSPNTIVDQIGLPCRYPMRIIENSPGVFHIPLRFNPLHATDYRPTFARLRAALAAEPMSSGPCCASGTCDCNDIHI